MSDELERLGDALRRPEDAPTGEVSARAARRLEDTVNGQLTRRRRWARGLAAAAGIAALAAALAALLVLAPGNDGGGANTAAPGSRTGGAPSGFIRAPVDPDCPYVDLDGMPLPQYQTPASLTERAERIMALSTGNYDVLVAIPSGSPGPAVRSNRVRITVR